MSVDNLAAKYLKDCHMGKVFKDFGQAVNEELETCISERDTVIICLALALGQKCDPCIEFWLRRAIEHIIPESSLKDVLALNVKMGGGPGMMYSAKAWDIYTDLKPKYDTTFRRWKT
jgi:alkylhydroperoxidase/carboxymuconolactone decarboxylase family protein YurZ